MSRQKGSARRASRRGWNDPSMPNDDRREEANPPAGVTRRALRSPLLKGTKGLSLGPAPCLNMSPNRKGGNHHRTTRHNRGLGRATQETILGVLINSGVGRPVPSRKPTSALCITMAHRSSRDALIAISRVFTSPFFTQHPAWIRASVSMSAVTSF